MADKPQIVGANDKGQFQVPVARSQIERVDAIDIDLVIQTKGGERLILPGAAMDAMMSSPPSVTFTDGATNAASLLSMVDKVETPPVSIPAMTSLSEFDQKRTTGKKNLTADGKDGQDQQQPAQEQQNAPLPTQGAESTVDKLVEKAEQLEVETLKKAFDPTPIQPYSPPAPSPDAPGSQPQTVKIPLLMSLSLGNVVDVSTVNITETIGGVTYSKLISGSGGSADSAVAKGIQTNDALQYSRETIDGTSGNDIIMADGFHSLSSLSGGTADYSNGLATYAALTALNTESLGGHDTDSSTTLYYAKEIMLSLAGYLRRLDSVTVSGLPEGVVAIVYNGTAYTVTDGSVSIPKGAVIPSAQTITVIYDTTAVVRGDYVISVNVKGLSYEAVDVTKKFLLKFMDAASEEDVTGQAPVLISGSGGGWSDVYVMPTSSGPHSINAGEGDNLVYAGNSNDTINSGSGNDTIYAYAGNDTIHAGDGDNTIWAGNGNDSVTSGSGNDTIYAGSGDNSVDAGAGDNFVTAGDGKDSITTGAGNDVIQAGGGNNSIDAGAGNNQITTGDGDDIINTGDGSQTVVAGAGTNTITLNTATGAHVSVISGAGDDTITIGDTVTDISVSAGDGANTVTVGNSGTITVTGGSGADHVTVGDSTVETYVDLGGGANWLKAGDSNDITVLGGAGDDNVTLGAATGTTSISLGNGQNYVQTGAGAYSISTGADKDIILTGSGDDSISAGDGDNTIDAGSGLNSITTGSGQDVIIGHGGNDTISAGAGNDTIYAGAGVNSIDAGAGTGDWLSFNGVTGTSTTFSDWLVHVGTDLTSVSVSLDATGSGSATQSSGSSAVSGVENLIGTQGNDTLNVSLYTGVSHTLYGLDGNDTLIGSDQADVIYGGAGRDYVKGGAGNDVIYLAITGINGTKVAGTNEDSLADATTALSYAVNQNGVTVTFNDLMNIADGEGGADTIYGGVGNDYFIAAPNQAGDGTRIDYFDGAGGTDTVDFSAYTANVVVNVAGATGYASVGGSNIATLVSIERIITGSQNDTVTGSTGADWIWTGSGNDVIVTSGGSDSIWAGTGNDTITISAGNSTDVVYVSGGAGADTFSAANSTGTNILEGDAGTDIFWAGLGTNSLYGGDDGDTFVLSSGIDSVFGGNGTDIINYTNSSVGYSASGINYGIFVNISDDDLGVSNAGVLGIGATSSYWWNGTNFSVQMVAGTSGYSWNADNDQKGFYAHAQNDVYNSIETISGSVYGDVLIGNSSNNWLYGNNGNDALFGRDGNDTLQGGNDKDYLDGGNGSDWADYSYITASGTRVIATLQSDPNQTDSTQASGRGSASVSSTDVDVLVNIENLKGGAGNDILTGNSAANIINGGNGNDTIYGGGGADSLYGETGSDVFSLSAASINAAIVINGGTGAGDVDKVIASDTWTFSAGSFTSSKWESIEEIDVRNSASGNAYSLNSADIQNIVDNGNSSSLTLYLDHGDTFTFSNSDNAAYTYSATSGFTNGAALSAGTYTISYMNGSSQVAQLVLNVT